jgi:hypothetical protein
MLSSALLIRSAVGILEPNETLNADEKLNLQILRNWNWCIFKFTSMFLYEVAIFEKNIRKANNNGGYTHWFDTCFDYYDSIGSK